jgi:hypothetical protein
VVADLLDRGVAQPVGLVDDQQFGVGGGAAGGGYRVTVEGALAAQVGVRAAARVVSSLPTRPGPALTVGV